MFGRILQILVGHAQTLSDVSSFNMYSKLNSLYWAFHICVNYILPFVLCISALLVMEAKFLTL